MALNYSTLEVRWFESGTLPIEVKSWFCNDCPGEIVGLLEEREDIYLKVLKWQTFSLKQRKNNLELKFRREELGIRQYGFWQSKLEKWHKLSCKGLALFNKAVAKVEQENLWIKVQKRRWQRQYQGVSYELTQLEISNSIWWSIAFEMVQQKASEINHFENVVTQVSQNYPGFWLSADKSYAYPTWLVRHLSESVTND